MDYEEMMLQISDVMRHANRLRPTLTHEEAVKAIRNIVTPEPSSCVLMEFGKCSYKETGCSDCKIKSNLRYMCHGSAWQELQALREFKEKHEKKGEWRGDV